MCCILVFRLSSVSTKPPCYKPSYLSRQFNYIHTFISVVKFRNDLFRKESIESITIPIQRVVFFMPKKCKKKEKFQKVDDIRWKLMKLWSGVFSLTDISNNSYPQTVCQVKILWHLRKNLCQNTQGGKWNDSVDIIWSKIFTLFWNYIECTAMQDFCNRVYCSTHSVPIYFRLATTLSERNATAFDDTSLQNAKYIA